MTTDAPESRDRPWWWITVMLIVGVADCFVAGGSGPQWFRGVALFFAIILITNAHKAIESKAP